MNNTNDTTNIFTGNINVTHATVRHAWNQKPEQNLLFEATGCIGNVNLSSIVTKLIQDCGRFAENYASDMLFGLRHIQELCGEFGGSDTFRQDWPMPDEKDIDEIFIFAIRASGVDHSNYFMQRACEGINQWQPYMQISRHYRRILAVRVNIKYDGHVTVQMKNLTHAFTTPNPADFVDEKLQLTPFDGKNPEPVDIYKRDESAKTTEVAP